MAGFGIGSATEMKKITPDQEERWYFGSLLVPFGLQKMIAIDAGGLFDGIFNNTLQETLLILIHEVTRSKHKSIIKKGFHCYLNKEKIINSADKGIIHQLPQGVFFALYDCNSVPVDGTDLDLSVVAICIELPH